MIDRHTIGDVAIAFLLAVPTVAMSRPQPSEDDFAQTRSPLVEKAAFAERTAVEKHADFAPEFDD